MDTKITSDEAILKLKEGNARYLTLNKNNSDVSDTKRKETSKNGQHPYAIIIGCSDSRAIPEVIFDAGIGDLFVIRVAGNVIDSHQLGSIEYAVEHLGVNLVVVLGHSNCGAVDAAMHHIKDGHIRFILKEIKDAIGKEKDPLEACKKNVLHSIKRITDDIDMQKIIEKYNVKVTGAVYHIDSGIVEFE